MTMTLQCPDLEAGSPDCTVSCRLFRATATECPPIKEPAPASDLVNHPPHYTAHPSGVECITITEHMGFNVGNAVKYLWRADEKGAALEDLRKAAWYVQREIERREAQA